MQMLAIFIPVLTYIFRFVFIKALVIAVFVIVVSVLLPVVFDLVLSYVSPGLFDGIFMLIPPEVWFFLDWLNFSYGFMVVLAAAIVAFLLSMIPWVGVK